MGANTQVLLTADQFLQQTKAKHTKVTSAQSYIDGGRQSFRMPQAGLGHIIWLALQGTITVAGTVTSGTFQNYPDPAPWSILKRLKFGSNNAFTMRDMSGWSLYKWIRTRYGFDPTGTMTSQYDTNNEVALGKSDTGRIVPGANITAATFKFNCVIPIPISYNNAGELGLVVLQQNSTFYDLTIDWGQITGGISATGGTNDLFNTLVGTGLTVTSDIKASVGIEWFEPVAGIDNLISMFMSVSDMRQSPLLTGTNVIKPPTNDFYTMFLVEAYNAGAPVAVNNINNPVFMHSGNVYDIQEDYIVNMARAYYAHGVLPPDGVITYDLGIRRGQMNRRDTLDAFNDMNITDLNLKFDIPSTLSITGNNGINTVMESLRFIKQI